MLTLDDVVAEAARPRRIAVDDLARKERLCDVVFDDDLASFEPGGPAAAGFLEVAPSKAVVLRQFGMGGREQWRSGTGR